MASASVSISCPACKKSFKGRTDLEGKKIRCPACEKLFVVKLSAPGPDAKPDKAKAAAKAPAAKGPPVEQVKEEVPPPAKYKDPFDEDDDPNPYGVNTLDMAPRCPNCANEMESADSVVCLFCGYNTQIRTLGETRKTFQTTFQHRLKWLAPGLGTGSVLVLGAIGCLYYCLVLPIKLAGSWASFLTHESLRLWLVCAALFFMWPMGYFAFKRLILEPTPPEIVKD